MEPFERCSIRGRQDRRLRYLSRCGREHMRIGAEQGDGARDGKDRKHQGLGQRFGGNVHAQVKVSRRERQDVETRPDYDGAAQLPPPLDQIPAPPLPHHGQRMDDQRGRKQVVGGLDHLGVARQRDREQGQ